MWSKAKGDKEGKDLYNERVFGDSNLLTIFTTGLFAGGIACIAVQGGLLATTLAQREEEKQKEKLKGGLFLPVFSFVLAKLIAYTVLGALLGWFGSLFQLSIQIHLFLQLAVVIFMVGTALNLLKVHPLFRYFVIQPPYFLARFIRKQSKRHDIFAPAILGASTIFIPCGATQAMMALAIASGNPLVGATILFVFILGTSPLFLLLGYFTMRVGELLRERFFKVGGVVLLALALVNFNGVLALTGTPYTFSNVFNAAFCLVSYCIRDLYGTPVTEQTITISPSGYSPSVFTVSAGQKITLQLVNAGSVGCQQAFTIPALHLQKIVPPTQVDTVTFTAPKEPTVLSFMCSMGMYEGKIRVL